MPTRALTVASVTRIKPPKRGQLDYFDKGFPGLTLRVSYGGAKGWYFFYRLHGKLRRLSLGRFPAMGLEEAREAWRAARLAVDKGESPAHLRPTTADTFAAVAEEWLKRDQAQNRSAAEVRRVIEHDVKPVWSDRLIAAIDRRSCLELIDGVADRGALTMARRLHAHLHRLFRWAVGRGIIEANPMADLPKPGAAVKRDRTLTDGELRCVWLAAGKTPWPFGPAVQLLVLTAARREEIGALAWAEIHDNEIRIPALRSKSGEPRIIPLSPAAAEIIKSLPRHGDHVFTTNGSSAISGWSKAKRAIDAVAAELNGGPLPEWRLHDLRRTVATGLQRLGVGLQVIESVLGHVSGSRAGVVGIYQRHRFEAEKRAALHAWTREVERIASGKINHVITPPAAQLVLSSSAPTVELKPIDTRWLAAVRQADKEGSFEPLRAYLRRPGARLGPAECWWLDRLLERLQFKRKSAGNFVPLGHRSSKEKHEIGAEYVRHLQAEGLSQQKAIDRAAQAHPDFFGHDGGIGLANYIRRGGSSGTR
jgi:integrase